MTMRSNPLPALSFEHEHFNNLKAFTVIRDMDEKVAS